MIEAEPLLPLLPNAFGDETGEANDIEGEAKLNQDRRLIFDGVVGGVEVDGAGRRDGPASALKGGFGSRTSSIIADQAIYTDA